MWTWTKGDDIKVLIFDRDSIDVNLFSDGFVDFLKQNYKIMYLSEIIEDDFGSFIGEYYDLTDSLQQVISKYGIESYSIVAISGDMRVLKEMMKNHIGTIFYGKNCLEITKYTPDFRCNNEHVLQNILVGNNVGYISEALTSNINLLNKKISYIKASKEITLDNGEKRTIHRIIGGRYFPRNKGFIKNDTLSFNVTLFKEGWYKAINLYYNSALQHAIKIGNNADIVTYVPFKPSEIASGRFNRFKSLKLSDANHETISLTEIFECLVDFKQKEYDYETREANAEKNYKIVDKNMIKDKDIILLDDLMTSGSTVITLSKKLYDAGAKNVTVIVLATNQLTMSNLKFVNMKCPRCGNDLDLRLNKKEQKLFFGCKNYNCKYTISYLQGRKMLIELNKLEHIDMSDVNDDY